MSSKVNKKIEELNASLEGSPLQTKDGFTCPVCSKPYKTEQGAKTHMGKGECINFHSIYQGTTLEFNGFKIYKEIMAALSPKTVVSFTSFSKSTSYNGIMRLLTLLNLNGMVQYTDDYLAFILATKPSIKTPNSLLKTANSRSLLDDFKVALHASGVIKSDEFLAREIENLEHDAQYFIRSMEKCKFSCIEVVRNDRLGAIMERLQVEYPDYYNRAIELIDRVSQELNQYA